MGADGQCADTGTGNPAEPAIECDSAAEKCKATQKQEGEAIKFEPIKNEHYNEKTMGKEGQQYKNGSDIVCYFECTKTTGSTKAGMKWCYGICDDSLQGASKGFTQ